jgi:uncharacterized delta-60 repeat protein
MRNRSARRRTLLPAFLFLWATVSQAAPGDWDPSWGTNGRVTITVGTRTLTASGLLQQSDGKLIAWGSAIDGTLGADFSKYDVYLARFNPNGTPDTSFNGSGSRVIDFGSHEWNPSAVVQQPDGKLLVAEAVFSSVQTLDRYVIVKRLNTDGSDDATFGTGGSFTIPPVANDADEGGTVLFINPDGTILAASALENADGVGTRLVRLSAAGVLDTTFGNSGSVVLRSADGNLTATGILRQSNGSYILPCAVTNQAGLHTACLMRVTSSGALDANYGQNGLVYLNGAEARSGVLDAVSGAGDQVISLTREALPNGAEVSVFRRVNSDGSPDSGFGSAGRIISEARVRSIEPEPNGEFLAAGDLNASLGESAWIARYQADGSPDPAFGRRGSSYVAGVSTLFHAVRQSDGGYIAMTNAGSNLRGLVRFQGSGSFAGALTIRPRVGGGIGPPLVDETRGEFVALVYRTGGSTGTVSVDYRAVAGTATSGSDFSPFSGTLTWQDGDYGTKTITLPILNDDIWENEESLYLEIVNPQGGAVVVGERVDVTLRSDETERAQVALWSNTYDVIEGLTARVQVARRGDMRHPLTINYTTTGSSATAGADFTAANGTLTWDAYDDSPRVIEIQTTADGLADDSEELVVQISNSDPGVQVVTGATTVRIFDETVSSGSSVFSLERSGMVVNESDASVSLTVRRYGALTDAASVTYDFGVPGSPSPTIATAGQDYTATSGTLNWAAGEGGSKTFTIPLLADSVSENPELFLVYINPSVGWTSKVSMTSVTIADDDATSTVPVITLVPGNTSLQESAGPYILTASLSHSTNHAVSVKYTLTRETIGGSDITALSSGSFNWNAGQSGTRAIQIPIVDDTRDETDETFAVTLSDAVGATLGAQTSAQVTVVDDDPTPAGAPPPLPPGFAFAESSVSVNENARSVIVQVDRTGDAADAANAILFVSTNTASFPGDYFTRSVDVSWGGGDTSRKSAEFFLNGDADVEGNETFTILLQNFGGGTVASTPSMQVTLLDDDGGSVPAAHIGLIASTVSVNESQQTVTLQVARSGNANVAAAASYFTSEGSATTADFETASGTLSWPADDTSAKLITVALKPDAADEPDETFTLTLTSASSGAVLDTASATITIVDDDVPGSGGSGGSGGGAGGGSGDSGKSGGGGALDYLLLLAMLALLTFRGRSAAHRAAHSFTRA